MLREPFLRQLSITVLIALLHLPLLYAAVTLRADLAPGQGLTDLGLAPLAGLLASLLLPYASLAVLGIHWNPARARLNEPDS